MLLLSQDKPLQPIRAPHPIPRGREQVSNQKRDDNGNRLVHGSFTLPHGRCGGIHLFHFALKTAWLRRIAGYLREPRRRFFSADCRRLALRRLGLVILNVPLPKYSAW